MERCLIFSGLDSVHAELAGESYKFIKKYKTDQIVWQEPANDLFIQVEIQIVIGKPKWQNMCKLQNT